MRLAAKYLKASRVVVGHCKVSQLPCLAVSHPRRDIGFLAGQSSCGQPRRTFPGARQQRLFSAESKEAKNDERATQLKKILARNEAFNQFAESLAPHDWDRWIKHDILPCIQKCARPIWPECKVEVHGSVLRQVHNKYDSDIDIAIHINGADCYPVEVKHFCRSLEQNASFKLFSDPGRVGKSIKFEFNGDVVVDVAIPERFGDGSFHDSEFIRKLEVVYHNNPEVRRAARIAKYAFSEMKGLDVEFLLYRYFSANMQKSITSFGLFWELVLGFRNFSHHLPTPPFEQLLQRARAQRGRAAEQDLLEAVGRSQVFANKMFASFSGSEPLEASTGELDSEIKPGNILATYFALVIFAAWLWMTSWTHSIYRSACILATYFALVIFAAW